MTRSMRWRIELRQRSAHVLWESLYLEPELYGLPVLDDFHDEPGDAQVAEYVHDLERTEAIAWARDEVPIYWSLRSLEGHVVETAPFQRHRWDWLDEDFLTFFHWPVDERGRRVNWFALPVRFERFPAFWRALGWKPSPLQPAAPLRSIVSSCAGHDLRSVVAGS